MVGPMLEADLATNLVFEVVFETSASQCKGHMAEYNVYPGFTFMMDGMIFFIHASRFLV